MIRVSRAVHGLSGSRTRIARGAGRFVRSLSALLALAAVFVLAPSGASATPNTLRRGFSNIINGPFDMALSPIVGGYTLAKNIADIDDSAAVRVVYALPGWVWLTGLNLGSGAIRIITGGLEMIPGVLVFAFEPDIDPLFDAVTDAGALVEFDNPIAEIENPWVYYNPLVAPFAIPIKFGISYTGAAY